MGTIFRQTPNNGYPFPPKWPLKLGTGLEASAAHPRPNNIWVPPPPPPGEEPHDETNDLFVFAHGHPSQLRQPCFMTKIKFHISKKRGQALVLTHEKTLFADQIIYIAKDVQKLMGYN